jgi:hypothetical protein
MHKLNHITGEDIPRGQSLRARMLVIEVDERTLIWSEVTDCQIDASNNLYASSLSGFLSYLAPRYEEIRKGAREELSNLREEARRLGSHKRTPSMIANLVRAWNYFLSAAYEHGAISSEEVEIYRSRVWKALQEVASRQGNQQKTQEPARRFIELLIAAISRGSGHIATLQGEAPTDAMVWGWQTAIVGTGDYEREVTRPQGSRIGWIDGTNIYLQPDASFAAAQQVGNSISDALSITGQTLRKRLNEQDYLSSVDETRKTLTVRRTVEGKRQEVLHMDVNLFTGGISTSTKVDQSDHSEDYSATSANNMLPLFSHTLAAFEQKPIENSTEQTDLQQPVNLVRSNTGDDKFTEIVIGEEVNPNNISQAKSTFEMDGLNTTFDNDEIAERAAIMEIEGNLTRQEAERLASLSIAPEN